MTEVTIEEIETNITKIIQLFPQDGLINWKQIKASQSELDKGFESNLRGFNELKSLISKNFLNLLKQMKSYEAKELLKQVKQKKIDSSQLVSVQPFFEKQEGGEITFNKEQLNAAIQERREKFQNLNKKLTEKLSEISKWLNEQIADQRSTLPKEVPKTTSSSTTSNSSTEESKQENQDSNSGSNTTVATTGSGAGEERQLKINFNETKLNEIVSQIQIITIPDTTGLMSIQTYAQIVEKSVDLAEDEFIRITFENRNERRDVMHKDLDKYRQLIMEHMNDIENLLMKAQEDICCQLGLSQEILESSEMMLMERGLGNHIFLMQAGARQQIKEQLPKQNQVSLQITKDIIQFQIKVLNNRQDYFQPILAELPNFHEFGQLIPIILNIMMNDLVFEEHNYEQEDYMQNLSEQDAWKDKDIVELMQEIEKGIFNLLSNLGYIPKGAPMMPPPNMGGMPGPGGMGMPPNMFF